MADDTGTRLHLLEGILTALERMAEVNALVAASETRADAAEALQQELGLSAAQAAHVLDLTVARQTKYATAGIRAEIARLRSEPDG
jgi:DNA gyrase/topoisomerase IV subunit A